MASSLRQNALLNASYQILRLIFPIVTYPYISRVLGPEGLGKVAYAQKIAEYFCLTALLGIPMYGLREISRARTDEETLSIAYSELLVLSEVLSLIAFVLYGSLLFVLPQLASEPRLHWPFGVMILVNAGRLDWFYQGVERYRFVTGRSLITRATTAVLVFVVIRSANHYVNYGVLWVAGVVISAAWNFSYSLRLTTLRVRGIRPWRHLRKILPTVGIQLVGTLYGVLDVAMLGYLIDDNRYSVGLYSMAGRIMRIALSIVIAGTSVLMPRIAKHHSEGDTEKSESLIAKSFAFTLFFSIPIAVGLVVTAGDFVPIFAGAKFIPAVRTTQILAVQLLIISVANVVNMQVFYARGRERSVFLVSVISVVLAIAGNAVLIPAFRHDGAAFATLGVTFVGLVIQSALGLETLKRVLFTRETAKQIAVAIIWSAAIQALRIILSDMASVYRLMMIVAFGALSYAGMGLAVRLSPAIHLRNWVVGFTAKRRDTQPPGGLS